MADKKTTQSKTPEKPKQVLVKAYARNLRIAPRKLRLVANSVKQMRAQDALVQLVFTNKKGASIVSKLIASAIANAEHNFSFDPASLYIQSISCDAAQVAKRFMPRARGSAYPLNRRMSHLNVVLESREIKGKKAGRFSALAARRKTAEPKKAQDDTNVNSDVVDSAKIPEAPKGNEQVKQAKVQQKRRLFNRRTGE